MPATISASDAAAPVNAPRVDSKTTAFRPEPPQEGALLVPSCARELDLNCAPTQETLSVRAQCEVDCILRRVISFDTTLGRHLARELHCHVAGSNGFCFAIDPYFAGTGVPLVCADLLLWWGRPLGKGRMLFALQGSDGTPICSPHMVQSVKLRCAPQKGLGPGFAAQLAGPRTVTKRWGSRAGGG